MKTESKLSKTLEWNGMKVSYFASNPEYFELFKQLFAEQKQNEYPANWKILARAKHCKARDRATWLIEDEKLGKFIFKRIRQFRPWTLEHFLRDWRKSMISAVEKSAQAHACGNVFPMKHYLVAERWRCGILRETYFIAEFITGTHKPFESPEQWLELVTLGHKSGFCWHRDAHEENFVLDGNGNWRGIDLYPITSSKDVACDLLRAVVHYPELKLPKSLWLTIEKWHLRFRKFFGMSTYFR